MDRDRHGRRTGFLLSTTCLACATALMASSASAQVAAPSTSPIDANNTNQETPQGTPTQVSPENTRTSATSDSGAASEEDIVVTGTLLRGIAPTGTNVVGLSSADIVATGATSTNQVLARIPQIANTFNQTPSVPAAGAARSIVKPNLRNLGAAGATTTLILVDGHRIVNAGVLETSPDPDVIPPFVLERVDVVPDGGSSIYGSDAVGGVINFITRKRFDGVQVSSRYGFADDYHTFDANAIVGKDWGSGSGYLAYSYAQHDAIFGRDRDYVRQVSSNSGFCAPGTVSIARAGVTTTYRLPDRTAGTLSSCDATDNASLYPRETRHSVFGSLTQNLADGIDLDIKGFYTRRKTYNYIDYNSVSGFGSLGQSGTITSTNPFYVPIAPDAGSQTVNFSYAGVFDNVSPTELEEFGITPSVTADLGGGWQLRALGNYGRSTLESHLPGIDATAQTAALAGTTTATALNPYNLAATNSTVLAGIYRDNYGRGSQELINGRLIVDGSLFTLAGGDIRLAGGVEYIRENVDAASGAVAAGQYGSAIRVKSNRDTESVFGEVAIPFVSSQNAFGGVQALTLSASGRYDHYSDFGSTFNPKVGLTYKPVTWVSVRGNWGTSFNAPSLADSSGAVDTRAQVLGVSPFIAPADPFFANFLRPTVVLAGGNPDLQPQRARTFSLGADIKFPFADGLTLSGTYYNIHLRDQIASVAGALFTGGLFVPIYTPYYTTNPTLAQVQALAGGLRLDGATSLASLFTGPFGGPYLLVDARRQNLGRVRQDGIDFNLSYVRATDFGSVNASVAGTYTLNRKISVTSGSPFVDNLKNPGASRLSLVTSLGAKVGGLTGLATLSHTGGYDINPTITTAAFGTQSHVKSFTTVDLFVDYALNGTGLTKDLSLTLNVGNLFDADPPFYNVDSGFTNGGTLGRLIQFGIKKGF